MAMSRLILAPIQRLREQLEDALVQADALDLAMVAIKIGEALDHLEPREDGRARQTH